MPESIYIQRQFMTFLGLEVYAEEIFFRVDDRDTDYVNTDMVLDRDRLEALRNRQGPKLMPGCRRT